MGFVHVYTGEGKGKTTAAVGLAVRAAGAGMKVCMVQFLKGRRSGEHTALRKLGGLVTVRQFGTESFVVGEPSDEDRRLAAEGLAFAREAVRSGEYGVVVLDEACVAVRLNILNISDLLNVLEARHETVEVVLTGRGAPQELIEIADLVTEMKEVKHYGTGAGARRGIEY